MTGSAHPQMPPHGLAGAAGTVRPPRIAAAAAVLFIGISAANTLPPLWQLAFYLVGLLAVWRRPDPLPLREALLILLACGYVVGLRLVKGLELDGALRLLRPCFEGFLVAHVLVRWCHLRDVRSLGLALATMVGLQALLSLGMAASPQVRLDFIQALYADESYQNAQFVGALVFRGYGITRHHLYGFSLAIGLSVALMLMAASLARPGGRRLALAAAAVLGLLVALVNARIGLVPVLLCYLAGGTLFFHRFYMQHLLATVLLLLLPLVYFGALYFGDDIATLANWVSAGLTQFIDSDSQDSSTLSDLAAMLVVSPDALDLLLGLGGACDTAAACYSDIGFIRALQEGGLPFLLLVLALYTSLNLRIVRWFRQTCGLRGSRARRACALLSLVVHGSFAAAMIKGEAFGPSDYSRLVATLAFLGLLAASQRPHRRLATARHRDAAPPPPATLRPV